MFNRFVTNIAFLGPQGSYSHTAAVQYTNQYFNQIIEYSCKKFSDIFKLVELQHVEYGILPLENSNSGLINEVCDLLLNTKLTLVGAITIPIRHCVLVNNHTSAINQVQTIYSHPQPVQQCSKFLKYFSSWKIILCASSAVAIETVAKLNQSNLAALGSVQGGEFYGLYPILSQNLSNQPSNITRFIILKNTNIEIETIDCHIAKKTMLIMFIDRLSNKICAILKILKFYNIKITYLRSRMLSYTKSENIVILEIIAHLNNKKTQKALIQLRKISNFLKILGCYPIVSNAKSIN